jgi:tetratricopeptide (TPR) repeat protein
MRAMLGGSILSGQALVRELRQRGILNLGQANALASFWDARSRVDTVSYQPTLTDVGFVRAGYNVLTEVANSGGGAAAESYAPPAPGQPAQGNAAAWPNVPVAGVSAASIDMPIYERSHPAPLRNAKPLWLIVGALVLVVVGAIGYLLFGRSSYSKQMASAIDAMTAGQTENARAGFVRAASDRPSEAEPHVFLARLSRNEGDLATAHRELETAIRNEPRDAQALREMGLLLLSENKLDLARAFFVRAIRSDTSDAAAKGYLGCALVRMNRIAEGEKFLSRAGTGSWTSCAATGPTTALPPPGTQ